MKSQLFSSKQSDEHNRPLTKEEMKALVPETNKFINEILDQYMREHNDSIRAELIENGFDEEGIEPFLQNFRRKMQLVLHARFREELRNIVLSQRDDLPTPTPTPNNNI